jgi:hypothetical protein
MRTRMYIIECDECTADITEMYRSIAEEQARAEGWRIGKRDVCPECQQEDDEQ